MLVSLHFLHLFLILFLIREFKKVSHLEKLRILQASLNGYIVILMSDNFQTWRNGEQTSLTDHFY